MEDVIKELDKISLISKDQNLVLSKIGMQSAEIFERQVEKSKRGKKLTKEPKYVRQVIPRYLSHVRTLSKWCTNNIEGSPGFTQEALKRKY